MESEVHEKAIEIIQRTNDGEDLAPRHLKLVENAVNGFLTEEGMHAFRDLHAQVMKGYVKPWFCGIEHLTIDHEGYVYWRGVEVEHYSFGPNQRVECKEAAEELSRRCRTVEERGEKVTMKTVIWDWTEGG